jgi:hypothetical protein
MTAIVIALVPIIAPIFIAIALIVVSVVEPVRMASRE